MRLKDDKYYIHVGDNGIYTITKGYDVLMCCTKEQFLLSRLDELSDSGVYTILRPNGQIK